MGFLLAAATGALRLVLLWPNTRHFDPIDEHCLGLLQKLPHSPCVGHGVASQQAEPHGKVLQLDIQAALSQQF